MASIALPSFVDDDGTFDFLHFEEVVRHVILSLNRVLERTTFPTREAFRAAKHTRSLGLGVQGLADALVRMNLPFDSPEARSFNEELSEALYYFSMDESCNLTKLFGTYPAFKGSPTSQGLFQFDLWDSPGNPRRYDWTSLRYKMLKGTANSTVVAYMPTAGTSQLTGLTESVEPFAR